jgi:hypothetical protein
MDLNTLKTNLLKLDFIRDTYQTVSDYYSMENLIILLSMIYIYVFSKYSPKSIVKFVKNPMVLICILAYIIYVYKFSLKASIFLCIALILTITSEDEIQFRDELSEKYFKPIINREGFTDKEGEDDIEVEEDVEEDADEASDEDEEEEDEQEEDEDEEEEDEQEEDEEDEEDEDEEEDDQFKTFDDAYEYQKNMEENFVKYGMVPQDSMHDTFKNLHDAIHNLENFMNSNNSK